LNQEGESLAIWDLFQEKNALRPLIWYRKLILFCMVALFTLAGALQSNAVSAASGPEGIEWRLAEVGGAPVSPLSGHNQPSIMFDAAQKKAAGFDGCNAFFCGYTLDGSSLKFGSIGSTRMAYPEHESGLETKFLSALDRTRGWKIQDGSLLLVDGSEPLARFIIGKRSEAAVEPGSMTYRLRSFPSGTVTLSGGEHRAPAAPGSASETVVTLTDKRIVGSIKGRETGAVVIVTSLGGTGSFFELALLSKGTNGWENTDTVLLGDRVKVHSVRIENDLIVVAMTTHGPNDPLCCPTLKVKKRFTVQDNRLVPAAEGTAAPASSISSSRRSGSF
jgi:heat shock protein HslJ